MLPYRKRSSDAGDENAGGSEKEASQQAKKARQGARAKQGAAVKGAVRATEEQKALTFKDGTNLSNLVAGKDASATEKDSRKASKASTKLKSFTFKRCNSWFEHYRASGADDIMDPEGVEKLCKDIAVHPTDVALLVLAWKLKASRMAYFTRAEWISGMTDLQCDCVERLVLKLNYLRGLLSDPASFDLIYQFAFQFSKESPVCKVVDSGTALEMLQVLLGRTWPLCSQFHSFIESVYKVFNRDQWMSVREFSRHIGANVSAYDENGAWPVMLDEFVHWQREMTHTFEAQTS